MSAPTPAALRLAGLALAHALWSVSDSTADELLCPLAFVVSGADQRLLRFEADTQEDAIRRGQAEMAALTATADAWAFALEGLWRPIAAPREAVDALTVECWAHGMVTPAVVLQRFARADATPARQSARFRRLGSPELIIGGQALAPEDAAPALAALMTGVESHGAVVSLWPKWQ